MSEELARTIERQASRAMDQIKVRLRALPADGTLVVNIGEAHTSPNHIMTQIELIRLMQRYGAPFVVADEMRKNTLDMALHNRFGLNIGHMVSVALREPKYRTIQHRLASMHRANGYAYAHMSHHILEHTLRENAIPTYSVDVQDTGYNFIDARESATLRAAEQAEAVLGYDRDEHPNWESLNYQHIGMTTAEQLLSITTRNVHMKEACDQLTRDVEGVRIILLRTGFAHIGGDLDVSPSYKGSLADLYARACTPYLGLHLSGENKKIEEILPQKAIENPDVMVLPVPVTPSFSHYNGSCDSNTWNMAEMGHIMRVARFTPLREFFAGSSGNPYARLPELAAGLEAQFNQELAEFVYEALHGVVRIAFVRSPADAPQSHDL